MRAETFDTVDSDAVAFQSAVERIAAHAELLCGGTEVTAIGPDHLQ